MTEANQRWRYDQLIKNGQTERASELAGRYPQFKKDDKPQEEAQEEKVTKSKGKK